ncbi:MAG: hypothetical protein ABR576_16615 [Thermoanaerobaculia bacterium]
MTIALELEEQTGISLPEYVEGSNALAPSDGETVTLRFRITAAGDGALEALRHARRSLLREEWTLGLDSDEPSLEQAVFSTTEVVWTVRPSQREWCLRKLGELTARARRALADPALPSEPLPRR